MKLSFIWHMHQPDYRDESGLIEMPWVFLHAIKDYYDMPWMLARHKGVKATFNITAPIIEQLQLYYVQPEHSDKFLAIWIKEPSFLDEDDRRWLIKICKSTQYDTMVQSSKRYSELYTKEHFNNNELIDLEVLFMLSWCGIYLKTNNQMIKNLILKSQNYTQEDKVSLLNELSNFVSGIFEYYKQLHTDGIIALSTTPLNHPILPLLMDMQNAIKANINTKIPKDYVTLEDDALLQVQRAQELFKETFGFEVSGFWPAEGGVDEKSIALLKSCGIEWIATDEEILFKSLHADKKDLLYAPYSYDGMCIGFRDHYLSDLIGFTYRDQNAYSASEHFINELQKIQNIDPDATAFVVLDGENAWEFYPNNGFDFFNALYSELGNSPWCQTTNMDEVLHSPARELQNLAPGSWINGSFDTWVGHSEKTRAWELIFLTKRDYEHHKESLDENIQSKIVEHFLAAECSDWFWWYGDDHYTEFGAEFDELFRLHLINIYELIGISVPSDLLVPIIKDKSSKQFWIKPQSDISPTINGRRDSFFEWIGCGVVDEGKLFSTMDKRRGPIEKIYYGQDDKKLYFAFLSKIKKLCKNDAVVLIIDPIGVREKILFSAQKMRVGDLEVEVVCGDWLEMQIDKSQIAIDEIAIRFELEKNGNIVQTLPGFGELKIELNRDYSKNWFI